MSASKKLRFAVLVDGPYLKRWQTDAIQHLLNDGHSALVAFIQNSSDTKTQNKSSLSFRWLYKKVDRNGPLELKQWGKLIPKTQKINFLPKQKGISNFLSNNDLSTLKSLQLDFALRFGFGILKGEALAIPTHGIWSFHHGDPRSYRGGPAAFWEIFEGNSVTGSMLQQLNEKLDQGNIIQEGFFQTINHSYKENLHRILEATATWPSHVVKDIVVNERAELPVKPISKKGKLYHVPGNIDSLRFLTLEFSNKIKFHIDRLFRAEKWNIGRVSQSIDSLIDRPLGTIKWLNEAPKNTYYADPFGWNEKEILLELFDYKKEKGSLKKLDTKAGKIIDLLVDKTHYSYPFSIAENGKRYLLPENYKSNKLKLYELDEKTKIMATFTLLQGAWIDPTLFEKDGIWWLSCTHKSSPKENLYLFYSKSIEGPYQAHELNPVLTDIRSARPAGTPFEVGGFMIRPTQNCSKTYGGSIVLKRITKISTSEYEEQFENEIFPPKGRYSKGLHTVSSIGDELLVDGKRYHFNLWNFWHQLKASFKK